MGDRGTATEPAAIHGIEHGRRRRIIGLAVAGSLAFGGAWSGWIAAGEIALGAPAGGDEQDDAHVDEPTRPDAATSARLWRERDTVAVESEADSSEGEGVAGSASWRPADRLDEAGAELAELWAARGELSKQLEDALPTAPRAASTQYPPARPADRLEQDPLQALTEK